MRASRSLLPLVLLAAAGLAGCAPGCERVCNKLERCGLNTFVDTPECVVSCDRELTYVSGEDVIRDRNAPRPDREARQANEELRRRFADERRCIGSSTCEEIADGACFDDELFPFGDEG